MSANLYQKDIYAWTQHPAAKLRAGDYAGLDSVNLAEELDSLGKAERRQLGNRLTLIIMHWLKMRYQSNKLPYHGNRWRATIREQRRKVESLLKDNPSLNPVLESAYQEAYPDAVDEAIRETNLPDSTFPVEPVNFGASARQELLACWPGQSHQAKA